MDAEWYVALGLSAAVLACSSGSRDTPSHERPDRPLSVQPVELGEIIRAAPIAFRRSGDGVMARGRYHAVAVSTDHVSLVPRVDGRATRAFGFRTMVQGAAGVTTAFEASSATSVSRIVQGVHERIENDDGHVEQVWAFPTRPAGSITVRVEVEGYAYSDETEAGLRFVDSNSGVSIRYGHATWIDARGSSTSVKARWSGRSIELALDERLLAASLFPATLDPIIVVELEPDAPVLVPDVRGQGTASVATSATTSLAVYENGTTFQLGTPVRGLYMTRLGANGVPIDACGTPLSSDTTPTVVYGTPLITYAGGIFLAAWLQSSGCNFEVRARRLDAAGTFLDATDLIVASGSSCTVSGQLRVAFDGSRFLLVWVNNSTGMLAGATVDPNGTLGPAFPIATVDGTIGAVAGLPGGGWSVGWIQPGPRNVFLTRIAADGTIVDPGTMLPGSGPADSPNMASSGTELLVAWSGGEIQAQRLDATGSPIGAPVAVTSAPGEQTRATVAWDGSAWFLVWEDARAGYQFPHDVYARRVSATGTLLGASDMLVFQGIDSGRFPWVGPTTGGVVAAQTIPQGPSGYGSPYSLSMIRRYDSSGVALDPAPVPIVRCGNPQRRPSVAWNGSHYLVVWEDDRNGPDTDVYGVRIAADGTVLDQMAIPISTAPFAQEHPVVVSDGAKFFVVWGDYRDGAQNDIYGTVVDAAGVVASPGGIPIYSSTIHEWEPVAAAGGGRFFVAWQSGSSEVWARVLDSNAAALSPAFRVSAFSGSDQQPSVSYGDSKFIVSFGRSARRYDLTGTAVDTAAITLTPFAGPTGSLGASDVGWLFTFTGGYPFSGVSGRRVGFDGSLPDAAPSVIHATGGVAPRSAWDAEQFLVVWQEPINSTYAAPHAIYAKRVTSEAEPVESTPVALTDGTVTVSLGGVAAGPPGSFLVVVRQWEAAVPYVNDRARALLVTVDGSPSGTPCTNGTECKSGLCIDGVCCRVRCGDGATGDCEACSVGGGGLIDGTCTAIAAGPVCRPATGECDVADVCDGTNRVCPPDQMINDGTVCAGGTCAGGVCMPPLPDAGTPDAATPDAVIPDAAIPDAAIPDAGMPDAAPPDASPPDASPVDAQSVDAFPVDAHAGDDATMLDASNADAGIRSPRSDTGCGCQLAQPNGSSGIILWLITFVLMVRRRRTHRR